MKPIYLEWWDAVEQGGATSGSPPEVVLFKGYTHLLEENEKEIVVAHFISDDGAYFDRLAIPRVAVVQIDIVPSLLSGRAGDT